MSPYVLCGFGTYLKTQTPTQIEAGTDKDSAFGLGPGVGMELTISPKKSYFFFEGKYHFVNFKDSSYTELASQGIPNLKGGLYTLTGGLLFTW
jgi:hypothetical protein